MSSRTSGDPRKKQIDTLKIFNDNVMEIRLNEEYSVGFEAAGRAFQLDVFLTPNFPNDSPTLALSPTVAHPWVQSGSGHIQNAPGLVNFSVHSDLGRVVRAIISELERSIPKMISSTDVSAQSSSSSSSSSTTTPTNNYTQNQSDSNSSLSSFVFALPDLASLTIDDLAKLNDDPTELSDFVEELDMLQSFHGQLDAIIDEVESIAEDNLSKKSKLNDLLEESATSRAVMRTLGERYDQANRCYQDRADQFAPQHIKELLQIAVSSAESESEQHVSDFLDGKLDATTFLDRYIRTKVLSTVRKAKEDRLRHQLNALERATF